MRGKLTADQARRLAAAVLGIQPRTSTDEARKAYLRKAAQTHPDVGGTVTAFRQLQTAWAVWEELDAAESVVSARREAAPAVNASPATSRVTSFQPAAPRIGRLLDVGL